jgi:hypothetical protein
MTVSPQKAILDAPREMAQSVKQVIEGRYIDREKLINFLTKTFGEGKFAVRVSRLTCKMIPNAKVVFKAPAQPMDLGYSTKTH